MIAIGGTMEKLTPQIGEEKHSLKDMQLEDVTSSGRCICVTCWGCVVQGCPPSL